MTRVFAGHHFLHARPRAYPAAGHLVPGPLGYGPRILNGWMGRFLAELAAPGARADALLVPGSSLTVQSGFRFVRHAARLGTPVAIVNRGPSRGDAHALLTLDAPLGATLIELLTRLGSAG